MKKQTFVLITLLILVNACSDNNDNTQLVETAEKDTYVQPRSEPNPCLLYTSPSPRDRQKSRMPSSA